MTCGLCGVSMDSGWTCRSCESVFCDSCFDKHWLVGPHEVVAQGQPTLWYESVDASWPRKLVGVHSYTNDGTGRSIWIPGVEPDEWFNTYII